MDDFATEICATLCHLLDEASGLYKPSRVMLAYSGGVDSTVLLHTIAPMFKTADTPRFIAAHINHGWHATADDWESHCRAKCRMLGVTFSSMAIPELSRMSRNLEETSRILRYRALRKLLRRGDVLLTAHHQNDQAETVLMQMLRGAGVNGLAAMPQISQNAGIYLLRPLLNLTRQQILDYARLCRLSWVEDESNRNLRHDRNYVHHCVTPILEQRWQQWHRTISRSARHQGEAAILLDRYAHQLMQRCAGSLNDLNVTAMLKLTPAEKKLLLRYWLKQQGFFLPSEKQLSHLLKTFLTRLSTAAGTVAWRGTEVRRYRNRLFAMTPLPPLDDARRNSLEWVWNNNTDLYLVEIERQLRWQTLRQYAPELAECSQLYVRLRRGGEKFRRHGRQGSYHQPLKKWFQSAGIPPWQRNRTPLIYNSSELRWIWV